MVPGDIVGIPAIPWLMPYLLGVAALFRAARDAGGRPEQAEDYQNYKANFRAVACVRSLCFLAQASA
jgi:hypothetical protein